MTFIRKMETLALQVQRYAWNVQNFLIKKDPRWILCALHMLPPPHSLFFLPMQYPFHVHEI